MASPSNASYTDPHAWRIDMSASEGLVSMRTLALHELPSFEGSFYLSAGGSLAGFTLRLPLPVPPAWLRAEEEPALVWESVDLDHDGSFFSGSARLRLGRRHTMAPVSGLCAKVPSGPSVRYLKIVLKSVFPSVRLRWPEHARRRLRPATLTLFSEIRPVAATDQEPPH
ncbi:hypothetical protein ABZ897_07260 [Nonomuraea sp. NPDC046802]|uniref:hypothetical protein n=1 Tax=Nonomuraea sp. NPDC046802 TaxID=3154919 RepID=UPI003410ECEE